MKNSKRLISVLLAVIMMLSALPLTSVGSFADGGADRSQFDFRTLLRNGTFTTYDPVTPITIDSDYVFSSNGKVTRKTYTMDGVDTETFYYTYHAGNSPATGYITFGDYTLYDNPFSYQAFLLVYKEGTSDEYGQVIIDKDCIDYDAETLAFKNSCWSSEVLQTEANNKSVRILFTNEKHKTYIMPNCKTYLTSTDFNVVGYTLPVNDMSAYVEPEEGHNIVFIYAEPINPALSFAIIKFEDGTAEMDVWTRFFNDVDTNGWYYESVMKNVQYGIMSGYGNGPYFGTNDNLKRQDFVCMIANFLGADAENYQNRTPAFRDIQKGSYYAGSVNWAVDNGIISGYKNGKFGVGDSITREQVCTILYRMAGSPAVSNINGTLAKFPDQNRISPFAREAVAWAVQQGIMNGMSNGNISSTTTASRAQIAAIMLNYINAAEL